MTLLTFTDLDRRRPPGVLEAWRLDRRSAPGGADVAVAVVGLAGGVLGAFIDVSNALTGGALGIAYPLIRTLWTVDTTQGGGELRRILPLRRRDVVTARYLASALHYLAFLGSYLLAALVVSLVTGRGVGEALFASWMAACVATGAVLAGMPVAAGRGAIATFIAAVTGGFVAMLSCLAIWAVALDESPALLTPASGVVALVTLVVLVVGGGVLSHRLAVRRYERKDL